jgi:hypothetical protein
MPQTVPGHLPAGEEASDVPHNRSGHCGGAKSLSYVPWPVILPIELLLSDVMWGCVHVTGETEKILEEQLRIRTVCSISFTVLKYLFGLSLRRTSGDKSGRHQSVTVPRSAECVIGPISDTEPVVCYV